MNSSRELDTVMVHSVHPASSSIWAGLLGEVGHVPGVQADAAFGDALGLEHVVEGPDGIGHAALQGIIGVHQKDGVFGVDLTVSPEGLVLGVKGLHPGVGHGAPGGHAVELVGDGAGRPLAPADEGGPGPRRWRPAGSLGPAGARTPSTARPRAARTIRLALVAMRDWWLMVSSR